MPHQHNKPKGASLPTFLVYEEAEMYCQYAGASKLPCAVFDRERSVIEAARRVAIFAGKKSIRIVFIIETQKDQPSPHPQESVT
jgi:hypothetical protein